MGCTGESGWTTKKAGGINLIHLKNPENAEVIDALRTTYLPKELLQLFRTSKSSYFYSIHAAQKDTYGQLFYKIREIFQENASCYGYRRIHTQLKKNGVTLSEKIERRIMRLEKLEVYVPIRQEKQFLPVWNHPWSSQHSPEELSCRFSESKMAVEYERVRAPRR